MVDVFVQSRRNGSAAKQFFKRLLCSNGGPPRTIVSDKLASYKVAQRELMSMVHHNTKKYANNRLSRRDLGSEERGGLSHRTRLSYF